MAARRASDSLQMLQDEPTATKSRPSGAKAMVRVQWPPPEGKLGTMGRGSLAFSVAGS